MRTWIKICGTTCVEDALASIEAGADALGFIFASSQRRVNPEKAQEIICQLPAEIEKIGVFLDAGAEEITRVVCKVDLTGIQMHGERDFPPEVYSNLPADRRDLLRKIKTVPAQDGFETQLDRHAGLAGIDAFLLDSGAGSGKIFDWRATQNRLGGRTSKLILAGGLDPANVAEAITIFHPWGVDVVTGVEAEPGRKDPRKLKAFVAAVRNAEKHLWAAQH